MRLSAIKTDPGYPAWMRRALLPTYVTLNGVLIQEVVTADDEIGELVRVARDEWGNFIIDGDEIVHETLRGVVRISHCRPDTCSPGAGTT